MSVQRRTFNTIMLLNSCSDEFTRCLNILGFGVAEMRMRDMRGVLRGDEKIGKR